MEKNIKFSLRSLCSPLGSLERKRSVIKKIFIAGSMLVLLTACGPVQNGGGKDEKPVATLNCSQGMSAYKVEGTSLQFCYDKTWGEPVVAAVEAKTGSAKTVAFGTAGNVKAPQIWLETLDFAPATGEKKVKFDVMNANASDEQMLKDQLKNAAGYEPANVKPRKSDVGGVRAIRADVGGSVDKLVYFVPNAFENYHMMISGGSSMAELIDEFVFDMVM